MENEELRKRLAEMTESDTEEEYLFLLESAVDGWPNSVKRLESLHPIGKYSCFVHAFEFTGKPEYTKIARLGFNVVYAGPDFAHWLMDNQLLTEISEAEAKHGDMVLYFNAEGRAKHVGIYLSTNRVESKWGLGHLFEHDLFAVPEPYGVNVKYFQKIPYPDALELFKRFAKEKGMLFI